MKGSKGEDRAGVLEENRLLQWFFVLCCTIIFTQKWQQGCVLRPSFPDIQAIRPYQEEIKEHLKNAFNVNTLFLTIYCWKLGNPSGGNG